VHRGLLVGDQAVLTGGESEEWRVVHGPHDTETLGLWRTDRQRWVTRSGGGRARRPWRTAAPTPAERSSRSCSGWGNGERDGRRYSW